jgi:shikimate kinase
MDSRNDSRKLPGAGRNVFLVGLMGAGKTSVGRMLARRLGKVFVDSDHEVEARTGVRIPVIFEIEGEVGFRRREAQVIAELAANRDIVLATGGGAVLDPVNRRALAANGTVIYLRAQVGDLWRRTRNDRGRPLLQTADPQARLAELYAIRDPLYREVADLIVDTGAQSVRHLVSRLVAQLVTPADPSATHPHPEP